MITKILQIIKTVTTPLLGIKTGMRVEGCTAACWDTNCHTLLACMQAVMALHVL